MRKFLMKMLTVLCVGLLIFMLSFVPIFIRAESTGLVRMKSAFSVAETTQRLEGLLKERKFNLFTQVDHAVGAKSVGLKLRPTRLLIFGNPLSGTPLMQCKQTVAIDLPMKALIWEDDSGQVWLGYNSPDYLKTRHQLTGCDRVLEKTSQALNLLAKAATQP